MLYRSLKNEKTTYKNKIINLFSIYAEKLITFLAIGENNILSLSHRERAAKNKLNLCDSFWWYLPGGWFTRSSSRRRLVIFTFRV